MDVSAVMALPLRYRPWRPTHVRLITSDLRRRPSGPELEHRVHIESAIDWLCRAQDVRADREDAGGVSAGWSFEDGWLPSYPETTGYIIETFIAAAQILNRPTLVDRAEKMVDWELSLQARDGAFPGHFGESGSSPVVFNTGQIMHGMIAGYTALNRPECLEAAVRAGHWLADQQDPDGCWRRYEHHDVPHVYNTRATWALTSVGVLANDQALIGAGRRNLEWAASQQTESGWFKANAFRRGQVPYTHTIAYAIRGFLEAGVLLGEERHISVADKAARGMAGVLRDDGWLGGTYTDGWKTGVKYSCLTGQAQMALNWIRLGQVLEDVVTYREPARRSLSYVKRTQRLRERVSSVRGGIPGSWPIWGAYSRFEFPNWSAKFFADALIMDMENMSIPVVPEKADETRERVFS